MDIVKYLEDRNIDWHREGEKNVGRGWVGIQCPFPGCGDRSWHCGINEVQDRFSCFICGASGNVTRLVMEIEHCSWPTAKGIAESYEEYSADQRVVDNITIDRIELPSESTNVLPKLHRDYLTNRDFDPDYLINKYKIRTCSNVGDYRYRLIIPFFLNRRLVTFTSRDVTDKAKSKYRHLPKEKSILSVKRTLYNIDSVEGNVIIVEGVTDVWRFGDGAVALMGTSCTPEQLMLIVKKRPKRVLIIFDSGEQERAKSKYLRDQLSNLMFFADIEIKDLYEGDPCDLCQREVNKIKRNLNK